nr:hypothetical protein [Hyphomonas sp.]
MRAMLRTKVSSIHRTGMVIQQKDISGLKCPAALPGGQGAAGSQCFKGVGDVRTVDKYLRPAPANLISVNTCNMLEERPVRANKSLIIEPSPDLVWRLEDDQIPLRNRR